MTVRPTEERDLPALLDIYNYEVENGVATFDLEPKTYDEWEKWFSDHRGPGRLALTAEIGGVPAGFAALSSYRERAAFRSTAELSVYVARDFRRRGVASALMSAVIEAARQDPTLHLIVSVITAGNLPSEELHRRFGFSFCGVIHEAGFKHGRYRDVVTYELRV